MVTAIIILSIIGLISATLLYIISRKFHVEEDSRIDEIESILPGANCGGCGYAGCRNFAEQCTKVTSLDSLLCPVGGNEVMQKIAPILGLNAVEKAPRIAVIRCNGSCENRPQTSHYEGAHSCAVVSSLYTGESNCNKDKGIIARKVCSVACIGCGKCVKICPEKAISLSDNLAYIDDNLCLSCQACVDGCPTHAIHAEIRNNIRETSTPRKETAIC